MSNCKCLAVGIQQCSVSPEYRLIGASVGHAGRDTDLGHLIVEGLGAGRDRVCMMELEFGTPRGLE